jgi:hypothetical protein
MVYGTWYISPENGCWRVRFQNHVTHNVEAAGITNPGVSLAEAYAWVCQSANPRDAIVLPDHTVQPVQEIGFA